MKHRWWFFLKNFNIFATYVMIKCNKWVINLISNINKLLSICVPGQAHLLTSSPTTYWNTYKINNCTIVFRKLASFVQNVEKRRWKIELQKSFINASALNRSEILWMEWPTSSTLSRIIISSSIIYFIICFIRCYLNAFNSSMSLINAFPYLFI